MEIGIHFLAIFQVCDYDLIGGGDPIGKIKLGWNQQKGYKPGFKHFKEVLENPRRPIIKWHVLQVLYIINDVITDTQSSV